MVRLRSPQVQNPKWLGLSVIAFVLLVAGAVATAQQPKKVSRIGYLSPLSRSSDTRAERFRLALRELGYIEGQNIAIEYRYSEGKIDRIAELAAELVRANVDIVVAAGGDSAIQSAMNATKTIPIVMMGQGSDPVRQDSFKILRVPAPTLPA